MGIYYITDGQGVPRPVKIRGETPSPTEQARISAKYGSPTPAVQPDTPSLLGAGFNRVGADLLDTLGGGFTEVGLPGWAQDVHDEATGMRRYADTRVPVGPQRYEDVDSIGSALGYAYETIGGSIPYMTGIAAGTLLGGPAGGIAAGTSMYTGSYLNRQMEEIGATDINDPRLDYWKALTAAVPTALLDMTTLKFFGVGGKMMTAGMAKSLPGKIALGATEGIVQESLTETAQQALEIMQANPDKFWAFGPEVQSELMNAAVGGAVAGGVFGGTFGPLTNRPDRRPLNEKGKDQLKQDVASEEEVSKKLLDLRDTEETQETASSDLNQAMTTMADEGSLDTPAPNAPEAIATQGMTGTHRVEAVPNEDTGQTGYRAIGPTAANETVHSTPEEAARRAHDLNLAEAKAEIDTSWETAEIPIQSLPQRFQQFSPAITAITKKDARTLFGEAGVSEIIDTIAKKSVGSPRPREAPQAPPQIAPQPKYTVEKVEDIEAPVKPVRATDAKGKPLPAMGWAVVKEAPDGKRSVEAVHANEASAWAALPKEAAQSPVTDRGQPKPNPTSKLIEDLRPRLEAMGMGRVMLHIDKYLTKKGIVEGFSTSEQGVPIIGLATGIWEQNLPHNELVKRLKSVLNHEAIHTLRNEFKAFTKTEWGALVKYVATKRIPGKQYTFLDMAEQRYPIKETAASLKKELGREPTNEEVIDYIVEEAVAEAFRSWADSKSGVPVHISGLFGRIVALLRTLGSVFKSDAERVFSKINDGTQMHLAAQRYLKTGKIDPAIRKGNENNRKSARVDSETRAQTGGLHDAGGVRGSQGGLRASRRASDSALEGLPRTVEIPGIGKVEAGPFKPAREAALSYMEKAGLPYNPPKTYAKVDVARAKRIADAFDAMEDNPSDPFVKAAYKAMIDETLAQWREIKKTGLKVEFITPEMGDPYAASPRLAVEDVTKNNHLWVFSTMDGYGQGGITEEALAANPLLADTGETIGGKKALANDIFRIVHDYFGHIKEGVGFRATGEENAWRSHVSMYSSLARYAATTETRGQNSWLNYGPFGEKNRTASTADTEFAEQKIGVLPDWVQNEGTEDFMEPVDRSKIRHSQRAIKRDTNLEAPTREYTDWGIDTLQLDPSKIAVDALQKTLDRSKGHFENLVAVDEYGDVVGNGTSYSEYGVNITGRLWKAISSPGEKIIFYHNHPNNTSLSVSDISISSNPGMASIYAIGHDGSVYRGSRTAFGMALKQELDRLSGMPRFLDDITSPILAAIQRLYKSAATMKFKALLMDDAQHVITQVLADGGVLNYSSTKARSKLFDNEDISNARRKVLGFLGQARAKWEGSSRYEGDMADRPADDWSGPGEMAELQSGNGEAAAGSDSAGNDRNGGQEPQVGRIRYSMMVAGQNYFTTDKGVPTLGRFRFGRLDAPLTMLEDAYTSGLAHMTRRHQEETLKHTKYKSQKEMVLDMIHAVMAAKGDYLKSNIQVLDNPGMNGYQIVWHASPKSEYPIMMILAPKYVGGGDPIMQIVTTYARLPSESQRKKVRLSIRAIKEVETQKVGEKPGGSAPGWLAEYKGQKYLLKRYENTDQSRQELMALALYRELGIAVPDFAETYQSYGSIEYGEDKGKEFTSISGVMTKWIEGTRKLRPEDAPLLKRGFATDAWLANWDVIGLDEDNILIKDGKPIRVDVGGSLEYRAMGMHKGDSFGYTVGEIDTLRSPSMSPMGARYFKSMTNDEIGQSINVLRTIPESFIRALDKRYVSPQASDTRLANKLIQRRDWLYAWQAANAPDTVPKRDRVAIKMAQALSSFDPKFASALSNVVVSPEEALEWWHGGWGSPNIGQPSALVDEDGAPLRLYHATKEDFDTFNPDRGSYSAFFFSINPEFASKWNAGHYIPPGKTEPVTTSDDPDYDPDDDDSPTYMDEDEAREQAEEEIGSLDDYLEKSNYYDQVSWNQATESEEEGPKDLDELIEDIHPEPGVNASDYVVSGYIERKKNLLERLANEDVLRNGRLYIPNTKFLVGEIKVIEVRPYYNLQGDPTEKFYLLFPKEIEKSFSQPPLFHIEDEKTPNPALIDNEGNVVESYGYIKDMQDAISKIDEIIHEDPDGNSDEESIMQNVADEWRNKIDERVEELTGGNKKSKYAYSPVNKLPAVDHGQRVIPAYVSAQKLFDLSDKSHYTSLVSKMEEISKTNLSLKYSRDGLSSASEAAERNRAKEQVAKTKAKHMDTKWNGFVSAAVENWSFFASPIVQRALNELGYDGWYEWEGNSKNVAVYSPRQIKSVFNTFDEGAAVGKRFSLRALPLGDRVRHSTPQSMTQAQNTVIYGQVTDMLGKGLARLGVKQDTNLLSNHVGSDRWVALFQDKNLAIGQLVDLIRKNGGRVEDFFDTKLQEELYAGRTGTLIKLKAAELYAPLMNRVKAMGFMDAELASLKAVAPRLAAVANGEDNLNQGMLNAFLYARHAPERNALIRARDENDNGSGVSDQEARAALAWFQGRRNYDRVLEAEKAFREIIKDTNKTYVDTGLTPDFDTLPHKADWIKAGLPNGFQFYAPLSGFTNEDVEGEAVDDEKMRTGMGWKIKGKENKNTLGRHDSLAGSVIAHAIMQNEKAVIRGERNMVGQSFLSLLEANPEQSKGLATILSRAPVQRRLVNGVVKVIPDAQYKNQPDVFVTKRNGEEIAIRISEPTLAKAMNGTNGLGNESAHAFVKFVGKITQVMAALNTAYNPEFMISNILRDIQTAGLNIQQFEMDGLATAVRKGIWPAMKAIHAMNANTFGGQKSAADVGEWGKLYDEMQLTGGKTEFWGLKSLNDHIAEANSQLVDPDTSPWGKAKAGFFKVGKIIEAYNDTAESATRLAVYKALRDKGVSAQRASQAAKNLVTNFNKGGEMKTFMNALYMFYNASIQGTYSIVSAMAKSKRVRKIAAGIVMAGVLQDLLMSMLSPEDENGSLIYDSIPDYILQTRMVFLDPFGIVDGGYISIPMPYGYNALFNAGRALSKGIFRGAATAGETAGSIAGTTVSAFNPIGGTETILNFVLPTILDPIGDLYSNKDFTGRPIYKKGFGGPAPLPNSQMYWNNTGIISTTLADFMNSITGGTPVSPGAVDISPNVIDYLFGYFTGGAGQFIKRSAEFAVMPLTSDLEDLSVREIPFVRKFFGNVDDRADLERYFEIRDAIYYPKKEVDYALANGDPERLREIRNEYRNELSIYGLVHGAETQRARIAKQIKKVEASKVLSEDAKDRMIKALKEQEKAAINRALRAYNQRVRDS